MSSEVKIISKVIDSCSYEHLFASFAELPDISSKAEMISNCLNTELGSYGFKSYLSADKTKILIDDQEMCKVIDFFTGTGYQPVIVEEQINRVRSIVDIADKNKIDLLWAQSGIRKGYYFFKQYGFNGANLYNLININTANSAAAAASSVGAALLTTSGVVALSWSGSMFFSTLENYIPTTMPKIKLVVSGAKFTLALPIRCVEWTSNKIFGLGEKLIFRSALPTNVTEVYRLDVGPKLKNLNEIKRPILNWLVNQLRDGDN